MTDRDRWAQRLVGFLRELAALRTDAAENKKAVLSAREQHVGMHRQRWEREDAVLLSSGDLQREQVDTDADIARVTDAISTVRLFMELDIPFHEDLVPPA